jgi:hypothetical protein
VKRVEADSDELDEKQQFLKIGPINELFGCQVFHTPTPFPMDRKNGTQYKRNIYKWIIPLNGFIGIICYEIISKT